MTPRAGDYDSHAMAVLRAGKLDEFAQNFLSILNASSNSNACKNVAGMISQLTSLCLTRKTTKVAYRSCVLLLMPLQTHDSSVRGGNAVAMAAATRWVELGVLDAVQSSFERLSKNGSGDTAAMLSLFNAAQQVSVLLKKPHRIGPDAALPYINRALSPESPELAREALGCLELMIDRDRTTAPLVAATCSQSLSNLVDSADVDVRREALMLSNVIIPMGDSAVHYARADLLQHLSSLLRLTDDTDEVLLAFAAILNLLVCCVSIAQLIRDSGDSSIQLVSFFAQTHPSSEVRAKAVAILKAVGARDAQTEVTDRIQSRWQAQDEAQGVIQHYVRSSEAS